MATKISASLQALSRELRYEPTTKHIRALLGTDVVLTPAVPSSSGNPGGWCPVMRCRPTASPVS
ncbi:hypothetical protein NHF46_19735 [Arthrobacter alpinus]|nr:hypothetical protein [Arthrobacter alpinus]